MLCVFNLTTLKFRRNVHVCRGLAVLLSTLPVFASAIVAHAAPIYFGPATTISAPSDVVTAGTLVYAAAGNNAASTTVNTVNFTGYNAISPWGSVTFAGTGLGFNSGAFDDGGLTPADADYRAIVRGATYDTGGEDLTVTLGGLTSGRVYAAQIWANDNRAGGTATRNETVTSSGGNTITLDYNSTNAAGGVGQFSVGIFAANATSQAFVLNGAGGSSSSSQLNAVQVRDVTNIGYWTGINGAAWDPATTNNFASNHASAALNNTTFNTAKAGINSVTFADEYYSSDVPTAVTQTSVTVDAGGVSAGSVIFRNSAIDYTLTNASGTTGITGSTAVAKEGTGTVNLNAANTYSGGTYLNGGKIVAANANSLGTGTVVNNGTLDLTAGAVTYTGLSGSMSGTGIVNVSNMGTGTATTTLDGDYSGFTGTWNIGVGAAAGAGKVVMNGAKNASTTINVLTNATVYVFSGTHSAGIVLNGGNTGESLGQLRLDIGATWSGPVTLAGSITDTNDGFIGSFSGTGTISGPIGESGGARNLSKAGGATIVLTGTNNYSGGTTIRGGTLQVGNGGTTGNLGATSGAVNISGGTLVINRSDAFSIAGIVSGSGALQKTGAGTTTLSGANTHTGTTTVSQGVLIMTNQGASNSSSYSISANATLEMNVASGTRTMGSSSTLTGAGTFVKSGGGDLVWGAATGTFSLGSGALIDVQGGTLIGGSNANEVWTNNKADLNVAAGATFDAVEATSVANNGVFVDAITGAGTIKVGYPGGYANKITFGVDNGSGNFTGSLQNSSAAGSFVKAGTGTQTLSGTNTYTGTTTVNAGTLLINGTHNGGGLYTVGDGVGVDTLGGTGTINSNVTIAAGSGVLAPGVSPGILNINGNVSIAGELEAELAGLTAGTNYDQLRLGTTAGTFNVTLSGTLDAIFSGTGWAVPNSKLWIVNNQSGGSLSGTFSNYSTNGQFVTNYDGLDWYIHYGANFATQALSGGNDVVLMAVPEPASAMLLAIGGALLWRLRRRKS